MNYPNSPETLAFDARIDAVRQQLQEKKQTQAEGEEEKKLIAAQRYAGEQRVLKERVKTALDCPEELLGNAEGSVPQVRLSLYGVTIKYFFGERRTWCHNTTPWEDTEIPNDTALGATMKLTPPACARRRCLC